MKIKKIKIENYRLLKNFIIDLEDELSLVIGKNNTGKTSLLSVLDKFLNQSEKNKITIDDFNLDFKNEIIKLIEADSIKEEEYRSQGIKLKLFIKYNEEDDLSNISKVMLDLDPNNKTIVLDYEYVLELTELKRMKQDYNEYKERKEKSNEKVREFEYYLDNNYSKYFKIYKKSIKYNTESNSEDNDIYINIEKESVLLKDIITFKYITAKRDVANREIDKTLSMQTSRIYKKSESSNEQETAIERFKDLLVKTDDTLSEIYDDLFVDIVEKVKKFGGVKEDDSIIKIVSTLQHRELLDGNTTVMYNHNGHTLPEHYNGLGYMNLISVIFEIELLIKDFKRKKDETPSDINLLFIEEPEAHTHPQMQYIFIKNIKGLLRDSLEREDGKKIELQYIISTHSSHIVSESDFNDIKYLKRESNNCVISKNMTDLEAEYNSDEVERQSYRFLKQYLTLNRAELFFADKAILIEGDTERIILPAIMKSLDQESNGLPLLSQYISIVEVGAHSQIFEKFIEFVGIKTLIITDIDSYYEEIKYESDGTTPQKNNDGSNKITVVTCPANDPKVAFTSNNSLLFFHGKNKHDGIKYFIDIPFKDKALSKRNGRWAPDENGRLFLSYQTKEKEYHARSFEDSFFHLNKDFIVDNDNIFNSLSPKWLAKYKNGEIDVFLFSEKAVGSKPSLAIEILLNSKADGDKKQFVNWNIPGYIKEGLEWLRKN